jgi:Na+-transporting NADH:ubiquinone oxidoreductase subunit NqrA
VQRYKEYSLPLLRTKPFENITFPNDLRENITVNIVDTNEIWVELEIR